MSARVFRFRTVWTVDASPEECWREVVAAFGPGSLTWWPGVRMAVAPRALSPGEPFALSVRAPLGYTLRMAMRLASVEPGSSLAAVAAGDLRGSGELILHGTSEGTELCFTWNVTTAKRWMSATAVILRPVFAAGHATVMRRGERALHARLAAR